MVGIDTLDLLQKISKGVSIPLAVGGGLDAESAAAAASLSAEIFIVGG